MQPLTEKLARLCIRRAFVYPNCKAKSQAKYRYGPLGAGMRRHFRDLWWQACVTSQDNVFALDLSHSFVDALNHEDIANAFTSMRSLLRKELPLAIAATISGPNGEKFNQLEEDNIVFNNLQSEWLTVYHMVPDAQVFKWIDHWQRSRLRWWRKFAAAPSSFTLKNVKNEAIKTIPDSKANLRNGDKYLVEFSFPWGLETVDSIVNHGHLRGINLSDDNNSDVCASVVEVRTSVHRGLLAYLVDAYREHGDNSTVLAIDPKLAAYKLAIVNSTSLPEHVVNDVVEFVTQELRDVGIMVLNLGIKIENSERMYDEMGVPYTVILTPDMLDTGVLQLRSRDTNLKEDVHITEVRNKVLKYTSSLV